MGNYSSGCYVIDSDYNVINVNPPAQKLYPQLEVGKKCHACLMGLDQPCPPCPVANGVKGPTTYTDPIRKISEIVDAVEFDIEGKGRCYGLVFSTVDSEAEFAATLPTSAEELKTLALIKALTINYYDVFSANLVDDSITLYRHDGKHLDASSAYRKITSYSQGIESFITNYVHPEDQDRMREQCSAEYLKKALRATESLSVHYRVVMNGEVRYFFRKIARVGEADSFENIVVGVGCEDDEVRERAQKAALQDNLRKVEHNAWTGLLTREAFFVHGDKLLKAYPERLFDFCILRIENLGSINHQYSRLAGDKSIQLIGRILQTYQKETSCIAYFGDGVFGSLTENTSTGERKSAIFEFRDKILAQSEIKNLTMKWSVYKAIPGNRPLEETFDKIAYAVSTIRSAMNQEYVEFDQEMMERLEWARAVENDFRRALAAGEFVSWYQPKYSAQTREVIGAEALIRWIKPNGEMVSPGKFIPVLENCGLINLLDEEVFRQTCRMQKMLAEEGLPQLPISVNLSRASIFKNDIAMGYAKIAESFGVDPSLVPIEITESAAVRAAMMKDFAGALIERGFVLHMDDFGSGYSSLASLYNIPFDSIKLDKSLVDFIGSQSGERLLKHTIAFAKESGMSVIAEGVETMEQYLFLKVAGCDAIQGYYFSKPVCEAEFLGILRSNLYE